MWMMWHPLAVVCCRMTSLYNPNNLRRRFLLFSAGQPSAVDPAPSPIDDSGAHGKSQPVIYEDSFFLISYKKKNLGDSLS